MPVDNLTQNFLNDLRGKEAGTSPVSPLTSSPTIDPEGGIRGSSLWGTQAVPEDTTFDASAMWNAVGVGLWSFADTALFGALGAAFKEEEFLDFEDPIAKWTGAFGGFAGFVYGAPMKIGAKILHKGFGALAKGSLKSIGKQTIDDVTRGMTQKGITGGLSKKAAKEVSQGYRDIARAAQVNPKLAGRAFEKASRKYMEGYIEHGIAQNILSRTQAQAVREMFTKNVFKRPLQDFKGLMKTKGIAATNPRLARVLGHTMDDAIMFGAIDTIFETVSMVEDRNFDWTAPLWGMGTGALFGQLSWLKPRGKSASFKKDFLAGMRKAFGKKDTYLEDMNISAMETNAGFLGKSLQKMKTKTDGTPEDITRLFSYKGKEATLNLNSKSLYDEIQATWGDDAGEEVMKAFLNQMRRETGRHIMASVTKAEAENLFLNWRRMALGGIFFNAHTFYDMYAHGLEPEVDDILPNFLIGAWVQRKSNPAKFDLRRTEINTLRQNMVLLGTNPRKLSAIPTFDYVGGRFDNIFNDRKYESVEKMAEDLGIISDRNEITETELAPDVISAEVNPVKSFDIIYKSLSGRRSHLKPKDHISVEDAQKISDEINRIDSRFADETMANKAMEESYRETQREFEDSFKDLVSSITDGENLLEISREDGILRIPRKIILDESLKRKAIDGELDFLVAEDGKTRLKGDEALLELQNKSDGFNAALQTVKVLGYGEVLPKAKDRKTIASEDLVRDIYRKVINFERNVENSFQDKSSRADPFTLSDSFPDYIGILTRNHAIRLSAGASEIFSPNYDTKEKGKLRALLEDAGILYSPGITGEYFVIDDYSKLRIEGAGSKDEQLSAKRLLGRVLSLQSITGEFKEHKIMESEVKEKHTVKYGDIKRLDEYLQSKNLNIKKLPNWVHSQIVNYAFMQRFEGSELSLNQQMALFSIVEVGGGSFSAAKEGRATGFTLRLFDEARFVGEDSDMRKAVGEYNREARYIIEHSGDLVVESSERIKAADWHQINALDSAINMTGARRSETSSIIADFLTVLSTTKQSHAAFQRQSKIFLDSNPANANLLVRWLASAGVLSKNTQKTTAKDIDLEKFTEKIRSDISEKMNTFGYDAKFAEARYKELESRGRDNYMEDSLEREASKKRGMDLNTFFQTYRIDGKDFSEMIAEESNKEFKSLIFADVEGRVLHRNVMERVLKRLHVKRDKEFINYNDMSSSEKRKAFPGIREHLVSLLGQQKSQMRVEVLKFKNGDFVTENETVQFTRMHDFLNNKLQLPHFVLDGNIRSFGLSRDGFRINERQIDIFTDTTALPETIQQRVRERRREIEVLLESQDTLLGMDSRGKKGEKGFKILEIAPDLDPIVVATKDMVNLREPFKEMINIYKNDRDLNREARNRLTEIETKIDADKTLTSKEYDWMFTWMMARDAFGTGSDGDRAFMEIMNGKDVQKSLSRLKLYHTKKYVRFDKDFINEVASLFTRGAGYSFVPMEEASVSRVLKRYSLKDNFGVAIWNDVDNARIRDYVEKYVKDNNLDWNMRNAIGDAHEKTSAFDSIAYVSRDMMTFLHAMMGHDPGSYNPVKPIISSGGPDSPLLLGKTVFVFDKNLQDNFFNTKANRNRVDILLTKSAAKMLNPVGRAEDTSIINTTFENMSNQVVAREQLREIRLESLGVLPMKDTDFTSAKKSQADANYMNAEESKSMFDFEFREHLATNLDKMEENLSNPQILRSFITAQLGDDALVANASAGEGVKTLGDMMYYATLSRDANPMSFSDRLVKNKMFNIYVNSVMNDMRSSTNQFAVEDSHHYGGSSVLVPGQAFGLKPTLKNRKGETVSLGEVMLPSNISEFTLAEVDKAGYKVRFLRGDEIVTPEQVLSKEAWKESIDTNITLGGLLESTNYMKENGMIADNVNIAVMVRRNPRTRPNDFALMSLKGFLDKTYGNSIAINSLDVANVMEGDYDFDKSDFFFAHRPEMFDHVKRASDFYVQGVDPSSHMKPIEFNMGTSISNFYDLKKKMIANHNVFKKGIGRVQKVPRQLGYIDKIAVDFKGNTSVKKFNKDFPEIKLKDPKILLGGNKGQDFMVLMDYANKDFFMRSAIETQAIIDMSGNMNPELASDIHKWKDGFIFPTIKESFTPGESTAEKINAIRKYGNHEGRRIRIFRKLVKDENGDWNEVNLNNLDRTVIKQMMNEYSQFLGITGDSVYENTGEQKNVEYNDVVTGAEQFFQFNAGINTNLYYKLRRRWGSNKGVEKSEWLKDEDFKSAFGVERRTYQSFKEVKEYFVSTKDYIHSGISDNAVKIKNGERGAPIDMVINQFWRKDPFNVSTEKTLGTETALIMDTWYNELLGGIDYSSQKDIESSIDRFAQKADELTANIKKGINQYNHKGRLIVGLKKKIWMIGNSKMRWDAKNAAISKLNRYIEKLEGEIGKKLLPEKYLESHKGRDIGKIEIVMADDTRNRIDGTIHYATMENIKNMLPIINGERGWGLGKEAGKDLQFIKKIRRLFYSNRTSLKEFLKYGGKTLLTKAEIDLLSTFPEIPTFYQLEGTLLKKGFEKHGPQFLYAFMQPSQNKRAVGIFNNRPVSVPYQAKSHHSPSARYRRGLKILVGIASGNSPIVDREGNTDFEYQDMARKQLRSLQFVESQFEKFFNRRISERGLFGEDLSDPLDISRLGQAEKMIMYSNLRLPNFNKDFEKLFSDFRSVQWNRDANIFGSSFQSMNDHLIDWYRDIMKMAGKEKEFDTYLEKMHEMDAQMMSNDFIPPRDYLNLRSSLDSEVKKIAKDVFVENGTLDSKVNGGDPLAKRIMDNPVTQLMGGRNYFKGLSLETVKDSEYNLDRLRDLKDMADSIKEVKENLQPDNLSNREKFKELKLCMKQPNL